MTQIDAVGKAKYFYYVDGLMTTNGFYIKLVKPVIFQHLYQIYLEFGRQQLERVMQMTIEFHMVYWAKQTQKITEEHVAEFLQYPPFIMFNILSQAIMLVYNELQNITCQDESQI